MQISNKQPTLRTIPLGRRSYMSLPGLGSDLPSPFHSQLTHPSLCLYSGCVTDTVTSICCSAALDALDCGCCVRRLSCQTKNTATPSIAASRQPPSARPIARPGPVSWVAAESLVVGFTPVPGGDGGGAHVHEIPLVQLVLGSGSGHW